MEQRWTRPEVYDVAPGHWKKQLAGKHLKLAARGKLGDLEQLLAANPEYLNRRGNHGRTLLWEACRKNRLEAVDFLLSKGADHHLTGCYNSESHVQLDCYCAARFYERSEVEARILRRGVEPDIFRASFLGDRGRVEAFLRSDPGLVDAEDPEDEIYRMPPLAFALAGARLEVAGHLIDAGAAVAPYSSLLIFMIGLLDRPGFLDPLLAAGLDPGATDSSTFVVARSLDTLAGLLDLGAPLDRPGVAGYPPLVHLCRADKGPRLDKIELLLARGADVNAVGPKGATALHLAARGKRVDLVSLLLEKGADRGLRDAAGHSPLDIATASGDTKMMALLGP